MSAPVQIDKHQPERRRRVLTTLHCGCTCCCCCCLHTLGSIIGAAIAPTIGRGAPMTLSYYYDDETGETVPDIRRSAVGGFSAVTVFWWVLCFLIFLGFLGTILTNPSEGASLLITGVVILLVFPAMQLASAFFTLIIFAFWPRPDKLYQMKQLGKVTAGVVAGSLLGIAVMAVIAVIAALWTGGFR